MSRRLNLLRACYLCLAAIAPAGCGCSDIPAEVEAGFMRDVVVLHPGDTATIRARVLNSGDRVCVRYASQPGFGGDVHPEHFAWASSEPSVAIVSSGGVVRAVQPGRAKITVEAAGIVSAPISLTVEGP